MQTQDVRVTGNRSIDGFDADEITRVFNDAVKQDIVKKQKKGLPVARYNSKSCRAYLEYANAKRSTESKRK